MGLVRDLCRNRMEFFLIIVNVNEHINLHLFQEVKVRKFALHVVFVGVFVS